MSEGRREVEREGETMRRERQEKVWEERGRCRVKGERRW